MQTLTEGCALQVGASAAQADVGVQAMAVAEQLLQLAGADRGRQRSGIIITHADEARLCRELLDPAHPPDAGRPDAGVRSQALPAEASDSVL